MQARNKLVFCHERREIDVCSEAIAWRSIDFTMDFSVRIRRVESGTGLNGRFGIIYFRTPYLSRYPSLIRSYRILCHVCLQYINTVHPGDCRKFNSLRQEIRKEEQRKEPFGVIEWKKMLTHPPYTKKAVDFMRVTRLPKQYKEVSWE